MTIDKRLTAVFAEAIGTFCFFVIGTGAIITNYYSIGEVGLLGIALAQGLVLAIMISLAIQ